MTKTFQDALNQGALPQPVTQMNALGGIAGIIDAILQGQGFSATTGLISTAASTNNYPFSLFNPANSNKTILLYVLRVSASTAVVDGISIFVKPTTSDPAYGSAASVANSYAGNSNASVASATFDTTTHSLTGINTQVEIAAGPVDLLDNNSVIVLQPGNGIVTWIQTYGAGSAAVTARWREF